MNFSFSLLDVSRNTSLASSEESSWYLDVFNVYMSKIGTGSLLFCGRDVDGGFFLELLYTKSLVDWIKGKL